MVSLDSVPGTISSLDLQTDHEHGTEEKGKKLGEFFNTTAAPPKTVARVPKIIDDLKSNHTKASSFGVVGYW